MMIYKIDEKGRIRLSSNILNNFKDNSCLSYEFDLNNSYFVINNNSSYPHHPRF
ncbi:MAG: hypothetical protein WCY27_00505 [archaeon]